MKLVIFGLTVSSSWGNGHATLWRGLCKALGARGHQVLFFERDVPYYASHRDLSDVPGMRLVLYESWDDIRGRAKAELSDADVGLVTSYCPDGLAASQLVFDSLCSMRVYYDLDTPVTLTRLRAGEALESIGPRGLTDYDLVLSFTGGSTAEQLKSALGARKVIELYGSVDPEVHARTEPRSQYRSDLSYMGTYAPDRQAALGTLLLDVARRCPQQTFLIGGAQYPEDFPWATNINFARHVPPHEHAAFYSSSRLTLNITREAMAQVGYCPSGRLFEAAACGTPIVSDAWPGLEQFFTPGYELIVANGSDDVVHALQLSDAELSRIGEAARARTLQEHTAAHRAEQLEDALDSTFRDLIVRGSDPGLPPSAYTTQ